MRRALAAQAAIVTIGIVDPEEFYGSGRWVIAQKGNDTFVGCVTIEDGIGKVVTDAGKTVSLGAYEQLSRYKILSTDKRARDPTIIGVIIEYSRSLVD